MHALLMAAALFAASPSAEIAVGAKAPDFSLPDGEGGTFSLSSFAGKKSVVLVFYPKAFTGG